ncbi:MAG: carbohydrate-binding domain-containing protein [Eubacteriales bacterium]
MKMKFVVFFLIVTVLSLSLFCSCNSYKEIFEDTPGQTAGELKPSEVSVPDSEDMFTDADRDASYDEAEAVTIRLSGNTASFDSSAVSVSDGFVTVKSAGTYILEGSATEQTVVVDAENEKVRLVLSDVSVVNSDFAALYIKNADKVFIILEGSNTLSVTGEFAVKDDNSVDGVIFAKDDITIQGYGSLVINSSSKHGIVGKDDIKITGGEINVSAEAHGIEANDSVRMADADLSVTSGKDAIHVENTDDASKGYFYFESGRATLSAGGDGTDASGTLQIIGGEFGITAGGGSGNKLSSSQSTKGIKSQGDMLIAGGTVTVNSSDDCIHSGGSIEISGGTLTLSSGDDGVHADTSLMLSGGTVDVMKSYEGLEAQNIKISGGNISVNASDDGINAAGGNDLSSIGGRPGQNSFNTGADCFIAISGGEIYVSASGDGIDANGSISVSGGTTVVEGPVDSGNGPLDYDGAAEITGGTFAAIGSSGMAMNFSSATQGSILLNVGTQSAGTQITLSDGDGNTVFSMTTSKAYSSVLISSPELVVDASYTLVAGSASNTVTLSSLVYGSGSGMGGGGGKPGGIIKPGR